MAILCLFGWVVKCVRVEACLSINVTIGPCWPGAVVLEVVFCQHLEHVVPSTLEEGRPVTLDLTWGNIGKLTNHPPHSCHLLFPLINAHGLPVGQVVTVT